MGNYHSSLYLQKWDFLGSFQTLWTLLPRHTEAKPNFISRNYSEFDVCKMWIFVKNENLKMWVLWKLRIWKCEFCEKWDFEVVNFVKKWEFEIVNFDKNEIFGMWIFGKIKDFCHSVRERQVSNRMASQGWLNFD